jgi:hypothetical protein
MMKFVYCVYYGQRHSVKVVNCLLEYCNIKIMYFLFGNHAFYFPRKSGELFFSLGQLIHMIIFLHVEESHVNFVSFSQ